MLGHCCDDTYGAITNYDNGDEDGNKNGNYDDNAASISGSNGLIFNLITMPQSRIRVSGDNRNSAAAVAHNLSMSRNIYPPYKDHIKDVP